MSMGLQEVHPSVVHMPLAFAPLAVASDIVALSGGSRDAGSLGRLAIVLAAGSGAVAAATGLIAQEEVRASGEAGDDLVTHRTLNAIGGALMIGMAVWRQRNEPSPGYAALGLGLLGTMFYSAYLGGKMVYHHGVGVQPHGVRDGEAVPRVTPSEAGRTLRAAGDDLQEGAGYMVRDLREGRIAPSLRRMGAGSH